MADLLRFTVPGKPEYVGAVRLAISSAANTAGFDLEDVEDIKIAVSEVCTNVFCCGDMRTYDVSCELAEDGIIISIDDGLDETQTCCEALLRGCEKEADEVKHCVESLPDRVRYTVCANNQFDPYTSIVMLRALMDEVKIFSDRNNRESMLIRIIKHF